MPTKKDPRRQLQGAVSKAQGRRFEDRLDKSFAYYRAHGFAIIEKTPEPMRPVKNLGNGRFEAFLKGKRIIWTSTRSWAHAATSLLALALVPSIASPGISGRT